MDSKERPRVLLLGNGILKTFLTGGVSWGDLLKQYTKNPKIGSDFESKIPFPLQVVARTEDHVDEMCKAIKDTMWCLTLTENFRIFIQRILSLGFKDIITTNYGYEIESEICKVEKISDSKLKSIQWHSKDVLRGESKYLLHTCYPCTADDKESSTVRVWHIHGEARKPDSMIIGHYYYGNLLSKYQVYLKNRSNTYKWNQEKCIAGQCHSWLDSFILGDVYILGFGFDLSELDLWWLLNRKKREKAEHGETVFYEPESDENYNVRLLLESYGCICESLNYSKKNDREVNYQKFYEDVLKNMQNRICQKQELLLLVGQV